MTKLKTRLAFFSCLAVIWGIRWIGLQNPLPPTWTPDSQIRFTARVLETPEQTDTKTVIHQGIWEFVWKGYVPFTVGRTYTFAGRAAPELLWGKIRRIEMVDPTILVKNNLQLDELNWGERAIVFLGKWRDGMVKILEKSLPEPHAALSAGILLGVKAKMPYDYYQALVKTGTLHVIAASGFNVMIVAGTVMELLLRVIKRGAATVWATLAILLYVWLAGASPSVVRAGIMGTLTLMAYGWGRQTEAKRLLWITAYLMLLVNPLLLAEVSFQLSVAATAGLLYIEPWMRKINLQGFLADYLFPTLAATVSTLPVILWHFGRISWVSPIANLLILPVVPLTMFLSVLTVGLSWVPILDKLTTGFLYVPLWWIVETIRIFG